MEPILVVSSILLWIVILFNLLLTIALIRRGAAKQPGFDMENTPTLEIGSQAPDFTAETLSGETITLADYVRKSVAFVFVSPFCPPCVEKIPTLNKLRPKAKSAGVELVLVNITKRTDAEAFARQHDIRLPILIAPRNINRFADDYKVSSTPFYCFISEDGKVESTGLLHARWDSLVTKWVASVSNASILAGAD